MLACEEEPGLGNGGLGRLAACYLDSLATLESPAIGYGIRYEFGIFDQEIRDGWQVEKTDKWLRNGNPWEIAKPDVELPASSCGGHTEHYTDDAGRYRVRWVPGRVRQGRRLRHADPGLRREHLQHAAAVERARPSSRSTSTPSTPATTTGRSRTKVDSETLTKVLYPERRARGGQAAAPGAAVLLRVVLAAGHAAHHRRSRRRAGRATSRASSRCSSTTRIPSIAVAELMRLLVDERRLDWDEAWDDHASRPSATPTTRCCPRRWRPGRCALFARVAAAAPRDHLRDQPALPRRGARAASRATTTRLRADVADRRGRRQERAHGAPRHASAATRSTASPRCTPSCSRDSVLTDFYELWPERFSNMTNGVTPRRFLALANPGLRELLDRHDRRRLADATSTGCAGSRRYADDAAFRERVARGQARQQGARSPTSSASAPASSVDPDSLFDMQVKRIHEYKRQHLNVLHIVTLYHRLKQNPELADRAAHVHLRRQGGARLLHGQADHQADQRRRPRRSTAIPDVNRFMKVVFVPELQRPERAPASIRPPICPSRSRPPARRPRAPAT